MNEIIHEKWDMCYTSYYITNEEKINAVDCYSYTNPQVYSIISKLLQIIDWNRRTIILDTMSRINILTNSTCQNGLNVLASINIHRAIYDLSDYHWHHMNWQNHPQENLKYIYK